MTRLMGVDCSTNSFAFSVFEDGKLVKWGEFSFGKGDIYHRMNNANRVVTASQGAGVLPDVDKVIFESATYIQNKQTVILLAYAFGAAISPLMKPGVEVDDVTPMTWQNFIGNKAFTKAEKDQFKKKHPGKKETWYKEQMRQWRKQRNIDFVKDKFGVDVDSDNIADAICVGWYGVNNV